MATLAISVQPERNCDYSAPGFSPVQIRLVGNKNTRKKQEHVCCSALRIKLCSVTNLVMYFFCLKPLGDFWKANVSDY